MPLLVLMGRDPWSYTRFEVRGLLAPTRLPPCSPAGLPLCRPSAVLPLDPPGLPGYSTRRRRSA